MFAASLKLPFPLLSDFPAMKVIRRYGVVHDSGIMAKSAYFLIDRRGIVKAWWRGKVGQVVPGKPILTAAQKIAGKF